MKVQLQNLFAPFFLTYPWKSEISKIDITGHETKAGDSWLLSSLCHIAEMGLLSTETIYRVTSCKVGDKKEVLGVFRMVTR